MLTQINRSLKNKLLLDCIIQQKQSRNINTLIFDVHTVKYVPSFGYVAKGEPLLYCGSSGYLNIDCNQASFMKKYSIGTGKEWTVHLEKESEI